MSTATILAPESVLSPQAPALELVQTDAELSECEPPLPSRILLDEAFALRDEAAAVEKISGADLDAVQADVASWVKESDLLGAPTDKDGLVDYYTAFSEKRVESRILGLVEYLAEHHGDKISAVELEATRAFVAACFANYHEHPNDGGVASDADGSFAFVVPARMARTQPEYGEEVEPVVPALRYVPNVMRSQMLVGLPPFVIDTYNYDDRGRRGYLIFAPVTEDIGSDMLGMSEPLADKPATDFARKAALAYDVATTNVNAAVDFARRRFGVKVVGLGATLPAVTRYGQKITNQNVVTTTGHGGTTELINMTIEAALHNRQPDSIGVLGLGSIGASIAHIAAARFPGSRLSIYDTDPSKISRTVKDAAEPGRFEVAGTDVDLLSESDVVISAIAGRVIDLDARGVGQLEGTLIVDDSQPGSVIPGQVTQRGGKVVWVIGSDSTGGIVSRRGYDYATMVNPRTDVFGCEAEAASISHYMDELADRGMPQATIDRIIAKVALRGPVTPQGARYVAALFRKYDIVAAEPQAFGQLVEL